MNLKTKQKGFTLVELLIVIVVIAILAAISIVAYNGIQNRAKASASQSAAETTQKKAEAANAIKSAYPATTADFEAQSDSSLAGSGIKFVTSLPDSTTNSAVIYQNCTTPAANKPAQQARVGWYDYTKTSNQLTYVYLGGAAAGDCTTWNTTIPTGGPF